VLWRSRDSLQDSFAQISPGSPFKTPTSFACGGQSPLTCDASTQAVATEFTTSSPAPTKAKGRFPLGKRPLTCRNRRGGGIRTHDLFVPNTESDEVGSSILALLAGQSFGLLWSRLVLVGKNLLIISQISPNSWCCLGHLAAIGYAFRPVWLTGSIERGFAEIPATLLSKNQDLSPGWPVMLTCADVPGPGDPHSSCERRPHAPLVVSTRRRSLASVTRTSKCVDRGSLNVGRNNGTVLHGVGA